MNQNKTAAQWIWLPELRNLPCTFAFFRKELSISAGLQKVSGFITADSRYELSINGKRIQKGPAPYDPRYHEYDPFDMTDELRQGVNTIGVLVCFFGHGDGTYIPGNPGLWFSLTAEYDDFKETVVSDDTWSVLRAECWRPGQYKRWFLRALQEVFDARLYPLGWNQNGYDDSSWLSAMKLDVDPGKPVVCLNRSNSISDFRVRHEMGYHMEKREIPAMDHQRISCGKPVESFAVRWNRAPEEFFDHHTLQAFTRENRSPSAAVDNEATVILEAGKSIVLVYELAEEVVGYPYIRVDAPAGTAIEILFAECRDRLLLDQPNSAAASGYLSGSWARVVTGEGVTDFEAFDYEALRFLYLAVRGKAGAEVRILDAGVNRRQYPFTRQPDFHCSDPVINRVHAGGVNTCLNICQETIVDNMVRERQQYSGEVGNTKLSVYLGFGEYRLPRRVIRTYARGQSQEGWFFDCFPAWDRLERLWQKSIRITTSPSTGMIIDHGIGFIFDIFHYMLYSGDTVILSEIYSQVKRHGAWLSGIETAEGYIPVEGLDGHSAWVDHEGYLKQRHKLAAMNIYYYGYLAQASASLAQLMDDANYRQVCLDKAARLRERLCRDWLDPVTGLFTDNLRWLDEEKEPRYHDRTLSMALLFNLLPEKGIKAALDMLTKCPEAMGFSHPANGGWRLWALSRFGRGQAVLDDLRNRWGTLRQLLENNTFPESWGTGGAWCQCPAVPIFILYGEVLGIRPMESGFKKTLIYPQSGDLAYMEGSVGTPLGVIALKAAKSSGEYSLEISLPGDMTAILVPPREYPLWDVRCTEGSVQTQPAAHMDLQALEVLTSSSDRSCLIITCSR